MAGASLRVADVFRAGWAEYNRTHAVGPHQAKAVRHLLRCRTAALGGHLYRCDECGRELPLYNSCQSRHCPTCQTAAREQWLAERRADLLPVRYFHSVFTLPHELNGLIDANRKLLFGELFAAVAWVLSRFAADPRWRLEGQIGFLAMLHTWTQRLQEHVHLHGIIPGGVWRATAKPAGEDGRADRGRWVSCRGKWLFRKDSLAKAFRHRFLKRLVHLRRRGKLRFTGAAAPLADDARWAEWFRALERVKWVVYPKPAAGGAEQVLEYLGRYTHKVAISDHRLVALKDGLVTYTWRDRADGNRQKTDTIPVQEFIHRFLYHILPDGFQKLRAYGWLSAANKKSALPAIREALHAEPPPPPPEESLAERLSRLGLPDRFRCPFCAKGRLVNTLLDVPPARGPPCA